MPSPPGPIGARPLATFTVAGFPVVVRPFFVLVLAAAGLQAGRLDLGLSWFVAAATGILWHELGHALAMRRFGFAPAIELYAFGGLTHWPDDARPTPREDLLVSAAGPAAGLLLGGAVWLLARQAGDLPWFARAVVADLLWVNVGWSLFNLLPILPLDGSHVLDALLRRRPGAGRLVWTGWASALTGAGLILYALRAQRSWLVFLGGIGLLQGIQRIQRARAWRSYERNPGGGAAAAAREALARGDRRAAAEALLPLAREGRLGERSLAQLASLLVELGRHAELVALVRARLGSFDRRGDAEPLARLAAQALADAERHAEAAEVHEAAFRQLGIAYHAYDAAVHLTAVGRHAAAIEWLARALESGLDCRDTMAGDPSFEPLRGREDFRALLVRM